MRGRRRLVVGMVMAVFGFAFEVMGIAAALPTVMRDLDAIELYGWAFSTITIGLLLATVVAGPMADRRGPLLPLLLGMIIFCLGLTLGSLAPNVWVLLLARLVQGFGGGALNVGLFVVIAHAFQGPERASIIGVFSFTWLLPAFLGPPLSAWISEALTWRLVFVGVVPLILIAAGLMWRPLQAVQAGLTLEPTAKRPGWLPIALLAFGPILIQLAGEREDWTGALIAVAGVVALLLGLPRVLPKTAWPTRRGLGTVVASRALHAGAFLAAEPFVVLAMQEVRGLTPLESGVALTIGSVGWASGSWLQARSWLRLRRDQLIRLGAASSGFGISVIAALVIWPWFPLWLGVVGWVIAGFGMGIGMASTAVATMSLSQPSEQGRHAGALQLVENIGNASLTSLAGAIYALTAGTSFWELFAVLLIASLLVVPLGRRIGPVANESLLSKG